MVSCLIANLAMEAGNSLVLITCTINFMISFILSEDVSSSIDTSDPTEVLYTLFLVIKVCFNVAAWIYKERTHC